jgi:two-component system, NarL family, sensor histidine kinase YdfH
VLDNGRGFDPQIVAEANGHYGLVGMKERATETGGGFKLTTGIGQGTQIEAVVPASAHS